MNAVLWILQALLALLFLFAGGTKLIMSAEALTQPTTPNQVMLPIAFIRFIGVCEFLGGLGLVLPGLLKTRQYLTRSEEHTSELQSRLHLVCRLLLEKKKT